MWMLKKKAVNKDWDKIMGPYWASLPAQGAMHTKETFPRDSLDLLQDGSMVHYLPNLESLFLACCSPHQNAGLYTHQSVRCLRLSCASAAVSTSAQQISLPLECAEAPAGVRFSLRRPDR